jgi:hypothetical protein
MQSFVIDVAEGSGLAPMVDDNEHGYRERTGIVDFKKDFWAGMAFYNNKENIHPVRWHVNAELPADVLII